MHENIPQLESFHDFNINVRTQSDYVCENMNNHRSSLNNDFQCWDCKFSFDH